MASVVSPVALGATMMRNRAMMFAVPEPDSELFCTLVTVMEVPWNAVLAATVYFCQYCVLADLVEVPPT